MPVDHDALASSLRSLSGSLDADGDIKVALDRITAAAVDLFGVAGSGIMLADEQSMPRYVSASDGPGRVLETVESEAGQGPCTEAFVYDRPVPVTDVKAEPRWPDLASALAPYSVHAVLGVPVRLGAITVGTLDVYRDHPQAWDQAEQDALVSYSRIIETTLSAALSAHRAQELADQLQYALDYRVVIERGVGYVMARDRVDAVVAFNRLRRAARTTQRKIGDVAAHLLEHGALPTDGTGRPRRS